MKKKLRGKSFFLSFEHFLLGLLFIPSLTAAMAANAEKLNEATIRSIYKESKDNIQNPSKTLQLMNKRLDANYELIMHASKIFGGAPPMINDERHTKDEVIGIFKQVYDAVKIENYEQNITDIRFSKDGVWGYVSQSFATHGTISVNMAGTPNTGTSSYTDEESCIDTLTLKEDMVKFVRSECKGLVRLTAPQ